jgi:hypothetical protein
MYSHEMVLAAMYQSGGALFKAIGVSKVTADRFQGSLRGSGALPRWNAKLHPNNSRFADPRAVLEMVLKNLRSQRRRHIFSSSLSVSSRFDGADYFSATNYFSGGETGDFRREHKADFQQRIRMQQLLRLEEQSGAADVFRGARTPALFPERTIAQWQMEIKTASSERWNLLFNST